MLSLPFPMLGTDGLFPGRGHLSFGDGMLFFFVLGCVKEYLSSSVQFDTEQTSPKMKIEVLNLDLKRQDQEVQVHRTGSILLQQ